jgi:hypothetical protein
MKNIPEILNKILKKRLNEELRLVGSERDTTYTPTKSNKRLKLAGSEDISYLPTGSSVRIETPIISPVEPNFSTKPNWVEPSPGEIKRLFGYQPQIAKVTKKSGRAFTSTIPEPRQPTIQTTLPASQADLDALLKAREESILGRAAKEEKAARAAKEAEAYKDIEARKIEAEKPKSPKLKLSGTDIDPLLEPKKTEWKQAYSPATLEFKVSPYGEFGSRDVIRQLSMPETGKGDSFVKKVMKGSTPAAKFTGRFAAQSTLGWPFHEAGEQFAKKMGIENPWGQYWTGWAASGAAADVLYPAVTTLPRLIAQGAAPRAALAAAGAQGLAALANPLNLAITLGPLAVWGAIEGADAIEEWYKTKDMTPQQKKDYKENKKLLDYLERYNEYEKEKAYGEKLADPDRLPLESIR